MKIEFYALFLFLISIALFLLLVSQKKEVIMEEVLPSPFVSVRNPYKKLIDKRVNEINRQLFFLEYGKNIPSDVRSIKQLETVIFQIQDPRALKSVTKRVWKYWWGNGIEEVNYKIKHINIKWYPKVYVSSSSNLTFGEALYNALNGNASSFSKLKSNDEIIRLIAEKYNVEIIERGVFQTE